MINRYSEEGKKDPRSWTEQMQGLIASLEKEGWAVVGFSSSADPMNPSPVLRMDIVPKGMITP
jgi:hypothetical protein